MGQRITTALIAVPILLLVIWVGDPLFTVMIVAVTLLGLREFYDVVSRRWGRPFVFLGALGALSFIINAFAGGSANMPLVALGVLAISVVWLLTQGRGRGSLISWAWTLAGVFFLGWTLGYFVLLRNVSSGREWVIVVLFTIFAADTAAFFVGKAIGKTPLAPSISPQKTWEGAVGGLLGAMIMSPLIISLLNMPASVAQGIFLGALVGIFSLVGDLMESKLKRLAEVKEASNIIPGHGGILDRLDSVVLTVVMSYYYIVGAIQ